MNGHFMWVYEGLCDSKPTKWLTYDKWDYLIKYETFNGELEITDSNGKEIFVFDEEDSEFHDIKPLSKRDTYKLLIAEMKKDIKDHKDIIDDFSTYCSNMRPEHMDEKDEKDEKTQIYLHLMRDFQILKIQQKYEIDILKADIKELKRKMPKRKKGLFKSLTF
jgi:hypothetical protein